MLVALGSIPRKNEFMANTPEVELAISTGRTNKVDGPLYYITVEVTKATDIVPDIFVMALIDESNSSYKYSRVASLSDIRSFGTSPITTSTAYRTRRFTIETNSLSYLKEVREGVQTVIQSLLDDTSVQDSLGEVDKVTTVTIRGADS